MVSVSSLKVVGSYSYVCLCGVIVRIYIDIALWCKNQIEHSI